MRKDPRSSAPRVGCTSLSLQTGTLLCVKNLQAICGGCVLTCPGWAVWGPAEEEARTAHSSPTKGLRCLAALQNQLGPPDLWPRSSRFVPLQLPPISATVSNYIDTEAWFWQILTHFALKIKLRNSDMNSHEKHGGFYVLKNYRNTLRCKSNEIKVNQTTPGYFVFVILFRDLIKEYLFLLEEV